MDLTGQKLKAYIVVDKDGDHLLDKLKNDPYSYIINESRFDLPYDDKTDKFLVHTFYTDYESAEDFASWYTGNCGEITQVKEIEISLGKTVFDSTEGWKALKIS